MLALNFEKKIFKQVNGFLSFANFISVNLQISISIEQLHPLSINIQFALCNCFFFSDGLCSNGLGKMSFHKKSSCFLQFRAISKVFLFFL